MGLVLNILIRLSILYFLGEVIFLPDDPRFAGKAIPIRNLIIVLTMSLLFPFLYFLKKRWEKYPVWLDNLYLSIFWFDMAGNSLDLYDSYFYFDLFPHMHGTGAIAAVFFGAFGLSPLFTILAANGIHMLLEAQEIFTDVFFGTHNVRGAFDSINDIIVGIMGTLLYVGILHLWKKSWHRRILKYGVISFAILALVAMFSHKAVSAHIKSFLFISQQFNLPIKPLYNVTGTPSEEMVEFETKNGKRSALMFVPGKRFAPAEEKFKKPVLIITFGVKNLDKDRPLIIDFVKNMARLGFVVFWPQPPSGATRETFYENPKTFVSAFRYVESIDYVDKERISFLGFSVGSSVAFVSAADPEIHDKVHGLVFFGGYYNGFDYYTSITAKTQVVDGKIIDWEPAEFSVQMTKSIFGTKNKEDGIKNVSPHMFINDYKTPILILHEKADNYVPYTESIKLHEALPKEYVKAYHIANLFDHVQPKQGLSPTTVKEYMKLYWFLYKSLSFL